MQVKICGLMDKEQALAVANAGAHAIGFIFYPPSPRNISVTVAHDICQALPPSVFKVGVFVDANTETIVSTVHTARLDFAQLHGKESPQQVRDLQAHGVRVIKVLRTTGDSLLAEAQQFAHATGILVEAGHGVLPGGNGAGWHWSEAACLAHQRPYILAGGLNADNIISAIQQSQASAVDLSSGVELSPGDKDLQKVIAVLTAVRHHAQVHSTGVVFA